MRPPQKRSGSMRKIRVREHCLYCTGELEPDYKDVAMLSKFVTERGKLLSRGKSGTCAAHQRKITVSVKQARFMALMPFVVRV